MFVINLKKKLTRTSRYYGFFVFFFYKNYLIYHLLLKYVINAMSLCSCFVAIIE